MKSDIPMVNGASAALAISDIPWNGPIAAAAWRRSTASSSPNPTVEQMFQSTLDLIYVGNEKDMLMIEGSADQIEEARFIEALAFGHQAIQPIIKAIRELVALCGKTKSTFPLSGATAEARAIIERVVPDSRLAQAIFGKEKSMRATAVKMLKEEAKVALVPSWAKAGSPMSTSTSSSKTSSTKPTAAPSSSAASAPTAAMQNRFRPISSEVGVLPRVHAVRCSSAATPRHRLTTLGPTKEAQDLDALTGGVKSKSFILHYNFRRSPSVKPAASGPRVAAKSARRPRERSLVPVLPPRTRSPTRSASSPRSWPNGSTLDGPICGGCLSLMDAGVPIIAPVAVFSCGLMTKNAPDGSIAKMGHPTTDILGEKTTSATWTSSSRHDQGHHRLPT